MLYLEARVDGRPVRWPLRASEVRVGRGADCEIVVDHPSISRRHLRIAAAGPGAGELEVEDLGSTNGLWLDGKRLERFRIGPDRWFVAGSVLLAVREGLSLTSLSGSDAARRQVTPDSPALPARPETGTRPAGELRGADKPHRSPRFAEAEALGRLAEALRPGTLADALADGLVERLLDTALVLRPGLAGAAVLVRHGEAGWEVRALRGAELSPEAERAAIAPTGTCVRRDGLLVVSLPTGGQPDARLVLHPWPEDAEPPALLELLSSLVARELCAAERRRKGAAATGSGRLARGATPPCETGTPVSNGTPPFLTASRVCRELLAQLDRLAETPIPVLIVGETGTGKELLARRFHDHSPRAAGPFVAVNCAALPSELIEAELFGIHKGVATGVDAREGRLLQAAGGTLLLDEVGDLPLELQPKLLRVLEEGVVTPVGAPSPVPCNVRIVSATNVDLHEQVRAGTFRADLLYRLAGSTVTIPPLRERPEDIIPLARAFAREAAETFGVAPAGLDGAAARLLLGYDWPGNVRELRHAIFRAVALSGGGLIGPELLPRALGHEADTARGEALFALSRPFREARDAFERLYYRSLVERYAGNMSRAAKAAGISRSQLYRKLDELGLR
ncbi:MAG: hypothetical protein Kow0062_10890 [Acidobacteriota bacterium]